MEKRSQSARDCLILRLSSLLLLRSQKLQFVQSARPVCAEQARERAVGQKFAPGLACRAIVGFVGCITNALDFRSAARAKLFVSAVYSHAFPKGRHILREFFSRF